MKASDIKQVKRTLELLETVNYKLSLLQKEDCSISVAVQCPTPKGKAFEWVVNHDMSGVINPVDLNPVIKMLAIQQFSDLRQQIVDELIVLGVDPNA